MKIHIQVVETSQGKGRFTVYAGIQVNNLFDSTVAFNDHLGVLAEKGFLLTKRRSRETLGAFRFSYSLLERRKWQTNSEILLRISQSVKKIVWWVSFVP